MSDVPELRSGPPWAMEEMIDAEPALAAPITEAGAVGRVAELVVAALAAGEPVTVAGCGTSEHAAMAGAAMLGEALDTDTVRARDAFEAALAPQRGGVLIAVSHEAGTAATLAAAAAAARAGARVALVTARPEGAPEGAVVLPTPVVDRSWCHTVGYVSGLLALHAVATIAAGGSPEPDAARSVIESVRDRREALRAAAKHLASCERLLAVGSGVDEITARELALKIEEGAHVPVTPLGLEKLLHGHLAAHDRRTGIVLLRLDPRTGDRRDARAQAALRAVAELSIASVVVGRTLTGAEGGAVVTLPEVAGMPAAAGALVAGALAAQLLTLELVMAHGTNPDLIRREEEPYRRAAEAAEGGA